MSPSIGALAGRSGQGQRIIFKYLISVCFLVPNETRHLCDRSSQLEHLVLVVQLVRPQPLQHVQQFGLGPSLGMRARQWPYCLARFVSRPQTQSFDSQVLGSALLELVPEFPKHSDSEGVHAELALLSLHRISELIVLGPAGQPRPLLTLFTEF